MNPYFRSSFAINISLFTFLKIASSVASLLYLLQLINLMETNDYAIYSVLLGYIFLGISFVGFGIPEVLIRYTPQLFTNLKIHSLKSITISCFLLLAVITTIFCLTFYFVATKTTLFDAIGTPKNLIMLSLSLVLVRLISFTAYRLLECLLLNSTAQAVFFLSSFSKLVALYVITTMYNQELTVESVFYTELFIDIVVGFIFFLRLYIFFKFDPSAKNETDSSDKSKKWMKANVREFAQLAGKYYLLTSTNSGTGYSILRVVGGAVLGANDMAVTGLIISLAEYTKKFVPGTFLMGFYRPLLISIYTKTENTLTLGKPINFILKSNIIFSLVIIVMLSWYLEAFLSVTTNVIYNHDFLILGFAYFSILLFDSLRFSYLVEFEITKKVTPMITSGLFIIIFVIASTHFLYSINSFTIPLVLILALILSNFYLSCFSDNKLTNNIYFTCPFFGLLSCELFFIAAGLLTNSYIENKVTLIIISIPVMVVNFLCIYFLSNFITLDERKKIIEFIFKKYNNSKTKYS